MTKSLTKLIAPLAYVVALPAMAHDGSEQESVMNGIVHFMTEADHLLITGLVSAVLLYTLRKLAKKRL